MDVDVDVDEDVDEDRRGREGLRQDRIGNPKKISASWAVCGLGWLDCGLQVVSFRCLGRWCDKVLWCVPPGPVDNSMPRFGFARFDLTD